MAENGSKDGDRQTPTSEPTSLTNKNSNPVPEEVKQDGGDGQDPFLDPDSGEDDDGSSNEVRSMPSLPQRSPRLLVSKSIPARDKELLVARWRAEKGAMEPSERIEMALLGFLGRIESECNMRVPASTFYRWLRQIPGTLRSGTGPTAGVFSEIEMDDVVSDLVGKYGTDVLNPKSLPCYLNEAYKLKLLGCNGDVWSLDRAGRLPLQGRTVARAPSCTMYTGPWLLCARLCGIFEQTGAH